MGRGATRRAEGRRCRNLKGQGMNARVKEPEPGHRFLSHSAPLPGPAEARGARSESTAPGWVNAPPKSCASPFSGPAAPPRAAAPGRGPSGHFGRPPRSRGASTCSTDVRRGQAAALLAGALPERPRRRGRGEGRARAGAAGICSSDPLAASGPAWPRLETASGPVPEGETDAR